MDPIFIAEDCVACLHDPFCANDEAITRTRAAIIEMYRWASHKSEGELAAMMSAVTWLTAPEMVAAGLATTITPPPAKRLPWSDSGVGSRIPPDVLARLQVPAHLRKGPEKC